MAKSFQESMAELSAPTAEQLVADVLESGEKILWTGRPNVELALGYAKKRQRSKYLRGAIVTVVVLGVLIYQLMSMGNLEDLPEMIRSLPLLAQLLLALPVVIILAAAILPRLFRMDSASRLERYFRRLSYGMTNHRLLILEDGQLTHAFGPDEIGQLHLIHRAQGCDDLIWFVDTSQDVGLNPNQWRREEVTVGFKAIANVEDVKHLIDDWIATHQRRAAQAVEDFIEDRASPRVAHESKQRITNSKLGFKIDIPEEWTVKARHRRKTYGTIFLDLERWKDPQATEDWNVLVAEGPAHASVEIHIDEGEPVLTLQSLTDSKLSNMFGGEVVDKQEHLARRGLDGFSITRRIMLSDNDKGLGNERSVMRRHVVFSNPKRQIAIVATWPDGSESLKKAVDLIGESLEI